MCYFKELTKDAQQKKIQYRKILFQIVRFGLKSVPPRLKPCQQDNIAQFITKQTQFGIYQEIYQPINIMKQNISHITNKLNL